MDDSFLKLTNSQMQMLFMRGKKVAFSLSTRKNSSGTNHQLFTNVQLFVRTARIPDLSPVILVVR